MSPVPAPTKRDSGRSRSLLGFATTDDLRKLEQRLLAAIDKLRQDEGDRELFVKILARESRETRRLEKLAGK